MVISGIPHVHGLAWLPPEVVKEYQDENGDFDDEKVPGLIDKFITVSTDTGDPELDDLVKSRNHHRHTKSCMKKGNTCRFGIPRFPSECTLVAKPLPADMPEEERKSKIEKYQNILKAVKTALMELDEDNLDDLTLDDLLAGLSITKDEYYEALKVSEKGKMVIHKRRMSEIYINNYNEVFMRAWQANMDLQFCLDQYSVVTYVTDYMSKVKFYNLLVKLLKKHQIIFVLG